MVDFDKVTSPLSAVGAPSAKSEIQSALDSLSSAAGRLSSAVNNIASKTSTVSGPVVAIPEQEGRDTNCELSSIIYAVADRVNFDAMQLEERIEAIQL